MKIDLHIHSIASGDGELTANDLVKMAKENNIEYMAITDHDSVKEVENGDICAKEAGINFIKGCEIFTRHNNKLFHMLVYGLDLKSGNLHKELDKINTDRENSVDRQFKIIKEAGLYLNKDEVFDFAQGQTPLASAYLYSILKDERNKTHKLVNGIECTTDNIVAQSRILFGAGKPLHANAYAPNVEDIVNLSNEMGAICILAHPGSDLQIDETYMIGEMKELGIKGVEAYYTTHTKEETEHYIDYAKKNDLILSVGSDFHGKFKPKIKMGNIQSDHNEEIIKKILDYIS